MHYLNLLSLAYYPQIEKLAQRKKDSVTILTQLTQFVTRGNHLKSIIQKFYYLINFTIFCHFT